MSNTTNSSQQYASGSQRYPDPIQQSRPSAELTDFHVSGRDPWNDREAGYCDTVVRNTLGPLTLLCGPPYHIPPADLLPVLRSYISYMSAGQVVWNSDATDPAIQERLGQLNRWRNSTMRVKVRAQEAGKYMYKRARYDGSKDSYYKHHLSGLGLHDAPSLRQHYNEVINRINRVNAAGGMQRSTHSLQQTQSTFVPGSAPEQFALSQNNTIQASTFEPQPATHTDDFEPDPALFDPDALAELFDHFDQGEQGVPGTYDSANINVTFGQTSQWGGWDSTQHWNPPPPRTPVSPLHITLNQSRQLADPFYHKQCHTLAHEESSHEWDWISCPTCVCTDGTIGLLMIPDLAELREKADTLMAPLNVFTAAPYGLTIKEMSRLAIPFAAYWAGISATQEPDSISRTRRETLKTIGDTIEPVIEVFREAFPCTAENSCGRQAAIDAFSTKYILSQRLGETQLDHFEYAMSHLDLDVIREEVKEFMWRYEAIQESLQPSEMQQQISFTVPSGSVPPSTMSQDGNPPAQHTMPSSDAATTGGHDPHTDPDLLFSTVSLAELLNPQSTGDESSTTNNQQAGGGYYVYPQSSQSSQPGGSHQQPSWYHQP